MRRYFRSDETHCHRPLEQDSQTYPLMLWDVGGGWSAFLNDRVRSHASRNGPQLFHLHGASLASHRHAARAARSVPSPLTSFRLRNLLTEMLYPNRTEPLERICGTLLFLLADGVRRTVAWIRDPRSGTDPCTKGIGAST
jgi:hypothetical protein